MVIHRFPGNTCNAVRFWSPQVDSNHRPAGYKLEGFVRLTSLSEGHPEQRLQPNHFQFLNG